MSFEKIDKSTNPLEDFYIEDIEKAVIYLGIKDISILKNKESVKKMMSIVALNYKAERFWQLNSWDKFIIPKPFTTIHFYASEPFSVEGLALEDAKKYIQKRLNTHATI